MPALEMAQEIGKLIRWLKHEGDTVAKGEPLMEIETDKVTVEIEATDSGILGDIGVREGDVVPVGQTIAWILAPGESAPIERVATSPASTSRTSAKTAAVSASPLARKIAEEHGIDLALVKSDGKRVEKADVLAYITALAHTSSPNESWEGMRVPASPKARRLAAERGVDLNRVPGSGREGAVRAADVTAAIAQISDISIAATPHRVVEVLRASDRSNFGYLYCSYTAVG